jgi:hypothetical protein
MATADLATDGLAVYRLTKLVLDDEITAGIREKVFDRFPPDTTKIGYLLSCPWCVSIYAGTGVAIARAVAPRTWSVVSQALAFSAATGLAFEKL